MNNVRSIQREDQHVGSVIRELADELKSFLSTRLGMLKAELQENFKDSGKAAVYGAIAVVFLITAYFLLTLAAVALVAVAFAGNPYAWFFALALVGFLWLLMGGVIALVAKREFHGLTPKHTMKVLKDDKIWIENEARRA